MQYSGVGSGIASVVGGSSDDGLPATAPLLPLLPSWIKVEVDPCAYMSELRWVMRSLCNELEATRLAREEGGCRDLLAYIQPLPKVELQRLMGTISPEVLEAMKGLVLVALSGIGEGVGVGEKEEEDGGGGRGATRMTMAVRLMQGVGSGTAESSSQTPWQSRAARPWRSSACGSCGWVQSVGSGGAQGVPCLDDSGSLPSIVFVPLTADVKPVPLPLPMLPAPAMPQALHSHVGCVDPSTTFCAFLLLPISLNPKNKPPSPTRV